MLIVGRTVRLIGQFIKQEVDTYRFRKMTQKYINMENNTIVRSHLIPQLQPNQNFLKQIRFQQNI